MILPPAVLVVLNHASTENVFGPASSVRVPVVPIAVPENVVAVFGSPTSAPVVPRVIPVSPYASSVPIQSRRIRPFGSPTRQKRVAPSAITASV
jgi:hypothetical protein